MNRAWQHAGRAGAPQVAALAGRPDLDVLARWRDAGVTEVLFGMPDRAEGEVTGYLRGLAAKLGLPAREAPGP